MLHQFSMSPAMQNMDACTAVQYICASLSCFQVISLITQLIGIVIIWKKLTIGIVSVWVLCPCILLFPNHQWFCPFQLRIIFDMSGYFLHHDGESKVSEVTRGGRRARRTFLIETLKGWVPANPFCWYACMHAALSRSRSLHLRFPIIHIFFL